MANNQPLDNLQRLEKTIAEEIALYIQDAVENPVNEPEFIRRAIITFTASAAQGSSLRGAGGRATERG